LIKLRLISLILLLGFSAGVMASCTKNNKNSDIDSDLEINFGNKSFKADTVNSGESGSKITVFTRDYKDNKGQILFTIGGSHTDKAVYTIRNTKNSGSNKFTIIAVDTSDDNKSNTPIPVNGFVVSIPKSDVDGLKIKENQEIEVKGFENIEPEYERFDFGTLIPENKVLTRRVSYINPSSGITEQPCITLITNAYGKDCILPDNSVALLIRLVASDNYRVNSIQEGGRISKGSNALVFVGEYNRQFAKNFFKQDDKLFVSNVSKISSYSDAAAVKIGDKVYKVGDERTNLNSIKESGVYLYNSYFSSLAAPAAELDFYNVAVVNDKVIYKGEKNKRILIPSNGGVVVSFVGSEASAAENLNPGDNISIILMNTRNMPDMYLETNGTVYQITAMNKPRTEKDSIVVYTADYGKNTGTGSDGNEIIINGNQITAIEIGKGSAEIPKNGYVISVHNSNSLCKYVGTIKAEDDFKLSLSGCVYSMTTLKYNNINGDRLADSMIIYMYQKSTGTNEYGYEIIVDANGIIISDSSAGNSPIPEGGFVLSGHGNQAKELQKIYKRGAKVVIDIERNTFTVTNTPMLMIESAQRAYDTAVKKLEDAKKAFYNIDYASAGSKIDEISELSEQTKKALDENKIPEAINIASDMNERLDKLQYTMVRSNAVENRAVWYRSNEKSDSEVTAVIEKAVALNINAIYLETWYNGMVIGYSDNPLIKHHQKAHGDFDALEAFCRIGHQYGIEIHVWVENFFIGTVSTSQEEDTLVNNTLGKHLIDSQGNAFNRTIYGDYVFLNPYDKENRALIYSIYEEIIEKYDIDGIHLDYIRFPELNFQKYDYGYNDDIVKAFQKEFDTDIDPKTLTSVNPLFDPWCKFRENIINTWVKEVYDLVRSTKPDLWITCACYPEALKVPKTLFQNVQNWVENGWIDEVFSMSYSADTSFVNENATLFKSIVGDKAFYSAGIMAFGTTTRVDFANQLDTVRDVNANGCAIFSLGSITEENYYDCIKDGPYSIKAVQTYKLSKTISAGMDEILGKIDKVYGAEMGGLSEKVKPLIDKLKADAASFNPENTSVKQKIDYTENTIKDLKDVISEIKRTGAANEQVKSCLITDFQRLADYMLQSQNRLKTRLK
jgi:uncharacterized lipoprotein YddW (UPF0748 family)